LEKFSIFFAYTNVFAGSVETLASQSETLADLTNAYLAPP